MPTKAIPLTIEPLQRVVAREITDPARIAAIEKMRRQARRKRSGAGRSGSKAPRRDH